MSQEFDRRYSNRSLVLFQHIFQLDPTLLEENASDFRNKKAREQFVKTLGHSALMYLWKEFPSVQINTVSLGALVLMQKKRLSFSMTSLDESINYALDMSSKNWLPTGLLRLPISLPDEFAANPTQAFEEMAYLVYASSRAVDELSHRMFDEQITKRRAYAKLERYAIDMEGETGWQLPGDVRQKLKPS